MLVFNYVKLWGLIYCLPLLTLQALVIPQNSKSNQLNWENSEQELNCVDIAN